MARHRHGRNVHGILLLDKPNGISSNAALQRAKRLFQACKAGHTGSLDNLATGLLPICLGEATKLSGFLLESDKCYQADCTLGITTTTGDKEGDIVQTRPVIGIDKARISETIQTFIGITQQIPPMYSALKQQGQPLYKLARQGKVVERQARTIHVFSIIINDLVDNQLSLTVHCSKGTYIRTLAEDIGEALGCGATISALRRISVGNYHEMVDFTTLEQVAEQGLTALDSLLMPMHTVLTQYPEIILPNHLVQSICHGQTVTVPHSLTTGLIQLFAEDRQFLGIGQVLADGQIAPKRLLNLSA